jgi:hypothetical protein
MPHILTQHLDPFLGGRPDAVGLAQAVAAANPKALHRLVLSRAQWAAAEGRWDDVTALLSSGFADQPSGSEFLEACVLMTQASLHLGRELAARSAP